MRAANPVRDGLKKYPTAHAYYLTLKEKSAAGGMTAMEWDWYRARQKTFEPDVYAAEQLEASRQNAMDRARKLSVDDLRAILAEKSAAPPSPDREAGKLSSQQIMEVLRKVTNDKLYEMLTCTRWKDGIDIGVPTFAAERLAEEFRKLAPPSNAGKGDPGAEQRAHLHDAERIPDSK